MARGPRPTPLPSPQEGPLGGVPGEVLFCDEGAGMPAWKRPWVFELALLSGLSVSPVCPLYTLEGQGLLV